MFGKFNSDNQYIQNAKQCLQKVDSLQQQAEQIFDEIEKQKEIAQKSLEQYALSGGGQGLYNLALVYQNKKLPIFSHQKAFECYVASAEQNYAKSAYVVGCLYMQGDDDLQTFPFNKTDFLYHDGIDIDEDNQTAFLWFQKSAQLGNPDAMIQLSNMYQRGIGAKKDKNKAKDLLKQAYDRCVQLVDEGDAFAMISLAIIYMSDKFEGHDLKKAAYWLAQTMHTNNADLMCDAAWVFEQNEAQLQNVCEKDFLTKLYTKAAELGNVYAMCCLGTDDWWYIKDHGTKQQKQNAFFWTQKASENGDAWATFVLAMMYFKGDGVAKDRQKAKELYLLAEKMMKQQGEFLDEYLEDEYDYTREDIVGK